MRLRGLLKGEAARKSIRTLPRRHPWAKSPSRKTTPRRATFSASSPPRLSAPSSQTPVTQSAAEGSLSAPRPVLSQA